MAYTREQKAEFIADLKTRLEGASTVYLTNYGGLTVAQANDLRGRFHKADIEFKVVKNTLLRRAMEELDGYEDLYDQLHGPTAIAISNEPAAPARVLKAYLKDHDLEIPELKGAYVDGAIYEGNVIDALASLKSKDELIGDIVGLLLAPITNIVGALQAPGSTLAGALQAIAEKEEA